jgi:hypothetical protein
VELKKRRGVTHFEGVDTGALMFTLSALAQLFEERREIATTPRN